MTSIRSYDQALDFILKGRDKLHRPTEAHTTLRLRYDGNKGNIVMAITVTYYDTEIVTYYPDGTIMLDTGKWHTIMTRQRMNEYLPEPWSVYQDKNVMYLRRGGWGTPNAPDWAFADRMCIMPDGSVTGAATKDDVKATKKLRSQVKAYAKGFAKEVATRKISYPSQGDCWFCLMQTQEGQSLGDSTENTDHLISHMEESYYVPALLVNAVKEQSHSPMEEGLLAILCDPNSEEKDVEFAMLDSMQKYILEGVERMVTRYLKKRLAL